MRLSIDIVFPSSSDIHSSSVYGLISVNLHKSDIIPYSNNRSVTFEFHDNSCRSKWPESAASICSRSTRSEESSANRGSNRLWTRNPCLFSWTSGEILPSSTSSSAHNLHSSYQYFTFSFLRIIMFRIPCVFIEFFIPTIKLTKRYKDNQSQIDFSRLILVISYKRPFNIYIHIDPKQEHCESLNRRAKYAKFVFWWAQCRYPFTLEEDMNHHRETYLRLPQSSVWFHPLISRL